MNPQPVRRVSTTDFIVPMPLSLCRRRAETTAFDRRCGRTLRDAASGFIGGMALMGRIRSVLTAGILALGAASLEAQP